MGGRTSEGSLEQQCTHTHIMTKVLENDVELLKLTISSCSAAVPHHSCWQGPRGSEDLPPPSQVCVR